MNMSSYKKIAVSGMKWILMAALLSLSLNGQVSASAIGLLDENTARIGYLVGVSQFAVDDPDGPTKATVDVLPLSLIYTDWLPHSWRYWAEAYYFATTLDANTGDIRQEVSRIGTRLSLQRNVNLGDWSLWLGAGLDVSRNQYTKRYTVDSDGFLLRTYEDRFDTAVGFATQLVMEWPLAQDWDVTAKLEHMFPVNGGITETALSAGILYRY